MAADEPAAPAAARLGGLLSAAATREAACPNCATPVKHGWQACPSCGYRMHVIVPPRTCNHCVRPVDRDWSVCPHCACTLSSTPDEQRAPARQMVDAARRYTREHADPLLAANDNGEAA